MTLHKNSKKFFYLFLIINAILWVCVESLRKLISPDAMEAVIWGNLFSFGTNKHPPLSGWLAGGFFGLFGENDIGIYLLGQLCIAVGLFFIYKTAKNFLEGEKAICASLIMAPCVYYTYQAFYDNFNCNYISIALWAILIYLFLKTLKTEKLLNWLLLGFVAGLCVLAKYQAAFLFFGMFVYALFYERKIFTQKGFYLAILLGLIVISPHIFWLFQTDFFSFIYLIGRAETALDADTKVTFFTRLIFPTKFYLDQILALAPCYGLYLILALKEKNLGLVKFDFKDKKLAFLLIVGLLPLLAIGTMGFFTTSRIVGAWASMMLSLFGIMLFYIFPINFKEDSFSFFKKWIIGLMCAWFAGMVIFVFLQKKNDMAYPCNEILPAIDAVWEAETGNAPLKYVQGHTVNAFQFRLYDKYKPTFILETYGHKNPWINPSDVKNSGILIIGKSPEEIEYHLSYYKNVMPENLSYKTRLTEYKLKNSLGKEKKDFFYYAVIPPAEAN